MQYTILEAYRHNLSHECFTRAADALFDLADALLTDVTASSLIELSQAACFRRGYHNEEPPDAMASAGEQCDHRRSW
jgi:hypothetical protein